MTKQKARRHVECRDQFPLDDSRRPYLCIRARAWAEAAGKPGQSEPSASTKTGRTTPGSYWDEASRRAAAQRMAGSLAELLTAALRGKIFGSMVTKDRSTSLRISSRPSNSINTGMAGRATAPRARAARTAWNLRSEARDVRMRTLDCPRAHEIKRTLKAESSACRCPTSAGTAFAPMARIASPARSCNSTDELSKSSNQPLTPTPR